MDPITTIRAILIMISAILTIIATIGLLRFSDDIENIIYARIHILGIVDMACILAIIVMYEPLLGLTYLVLAPFAMHAIANAHFGGEENYD